ncbi:hypothetical protein J1605_018615 [Eschrichtius robustus]|uniref:Uncharacterized protein n=1 Tax=Eschrichtius robustus TaxID=9764 RepID=A0AB34HV91_ESCRO|nr:hypothetical protein J1605_018615 [Eschrichtius robustus]
MAAAAGRSLLLLLSSRGGGGAGGCGALTVGCFPALGVSRHRQQQHHRTVVVAALPRGRRRQRWVSANDAWETPLRGRYGAGSTFGGDREPEEGEAKELCGCRNFG